MKHLFSLLALLISLLAPFQVVAQEASNNPGAKHSNGEFTLPVLPAGQHYKLYFPMAKPVTWELPEGTTFIRAPMPAGATSWQAIMLPGTSTAVLQVTQTQATYSPWQLVDGDLSISWPTRSFDITTSYKITGREVAASDAQVKAPKDWDKLGPFECDTRLCDRGYKFPLKPGNIAVYKVEAVDMYGVVLASSEEKTVTVAGTLQQRVKDSGFKLSRSDTLNKVAAGEAALLNWNASHKAGGKRETAYHTEFALVWDAPQPWVADWYRRASLEAALTSGGTQKDSDAYKIRYGAYRLIGELDGEGAELVANLKYEAERKGGTKKGLFEFAYTPRIGWLGRGINVPQKGARDGSGNLITPQWLSIKPLLTLGTEVGRTFDAGTSAEARDTLLRFKAVARLDFDFPRTAAALNIPSLSASLSATQWHLPREADKSHSLGSAGITFGLRNDVGIVLTHTVGRDAPAFKFARSTSVGLGFKF